MCRNAEIQEEGKAASAACIGLLSGEVAEPIRIKDVNDLQDDQMSCLTLMGPDLGGLVDQFGPTTEPIEELVARRLDPAAHFRPGKFP